MSTSTRATRRSGAPSACSPACLVTTSTSPSGASAAEFSVAQGVYVASGSGWFSDRTSRYLASGKPALVQDTGFSRHLPTGEGLVAFTTLEDAIAGADAIVSDYDRHARAARWV